ncbi:MAG: rRNA methyltransferase [Pseudonocardiales bacterium]|nr:MAG: rRNA methyltransferase [Pseudonocardiales bacterium]
MPPVDITDPDDPRVGDYLCLTDVDLRTKFEPPRGLFIAEGELVIRRAVRAGYRLRSVLLSPAWLRSLPRLGLPPDTPLYVAGAAVLEAITGFRVHRGALASVHRRPLPPPTALLSVARRVAVLEDVNTHTNVGAIFRCAAALGMDAVLLSPSCADPLYRRAVRVSMGEVFAVPYARLESWPADLDLLREAQFRLLALTPDPAATALDDAGLSATGPAALLLGAEGPGLSPAALGRVDQRVRIPMSAGVDSLNVAAAAAVAFYVLGRRGAAGPGAGDSSR